MPMNFSCMQMWLCPARQAAQRPQGSSGITVTRSPGFQPSTPEPVAAMAPDISWPNTCGNVTR